MLRPPNPPTPHPNAAPPDATGPWAQDPILAPLLAGLSDPDPCLEPLHGGGPPPAPSPTLALPLTSATVQLLLTQHPSRVLRRHVYSQVRGLWGLGG